MTKAELIQRIMDGVLGSPANRESDDDVTELQAALVKEGILVEHREHLGEIMGIKQSRVWYTVNWGSLDDD